MKKTITLISILIAGLLSFNTLAATATIGPCKDRGCVDYFKEYKKYARIGFTDAMVTLAEMYYYGHGTEINMKKALKQFKNAAKYGSVKGQFKTAMMYFSAEFLDLDKGIKYLQKAARNNSVDASFLLGIMYFDPEFYEKNYEKSDKWLSKAYRKGYNKMPSYITLMKKSGHFNEANFPKLIEAIENTPITIIKVAQVKVEPTAPTQTKSQNLTKVSGQTAENSAISDVEVITVYSNLNDILDSQLLSFRYSRPEKGAQNTGSRIIGNTCAKTMSCAPTSTEDFKRGVRLVLGDQAVATFSESFRGYSGF